MYQCCQLLAELYGQSGRKIQLLRKKVLIWFGLRYFLNAVSFWSNYTKSCHVTKGTNFFFSMAEFYGHSGQIILKRVGNTGRRASNCRKIFLEANFKGMRFSVMVRASDCHCQSRNSPSIHRHSEIWGAADEAVLNTVHRKKIAKIPFVILKGSRHKYYISIHATAAFSEDRESGGGGLRFTWGIPN